jgi:hypothetical protein
LCEESGDLLSAIVEAEASRQQALASLAHRY